MDRKVLREMAVTMFKAGQETQIPAGFGVDLIVIAVNRNGDFEMVANGMDVNLGVGILQRCVMTLHNSANALSGITKPDSESSH